MKNKTPLLLTGIVILGAVAGFLGYELNTQKKQNKIYQSEMTEMKELIKGSDLSDMMGDDISESLNSLLDEYNSISTNNKELNDSIELQKEKVTLLLSEIENSENRRKYTATQLFKMKKEAQTLRNVMKNYVYKVDSLNTLNKELQATIVVKDNEITQVAGERDQLKTTTETLSKTVELGSKLQILNLRAEAIKTRFSGSYTETTRAKRAEQIKSCFTIVANNIAKPGKKTFYMRIISPDNKVLTNTKSTKIMSGDKEKEVSISRTIDYQNTSLDLCIFYEKSLDKLPSGDYKVEIYSEGLLVGTTTISLR